MSLPLYSPDLYIPYADIATATNNFQNILGKGGFGPVYKGELLRFGKLTTVAVKRLQYDERSGQGLKEFLTEIQLLSCYKHSNLVSLLGFCEENNEKVLVYEFAGNGSLERYLRPYKTKCPLTWKQRVNICIDAARGLNYLHNEVAENQRVIHRDIKSANILLDHNWKGMIADLGLSKIGRANEDVTYLITNACGTSGYCDPAYIETRVLTDKSDVYSFGVVLFELLCGRLCYIDNADPKQRFLAQVARQYHQEQRLNLIIDPDLENHMNSDSVKEFSDLAYQCLEPDRAQRPSMGLVLQTLEETLKLIEFEETGDNQWISVDENGKSRVMISATNLIFLDGKKCGSVAVSKRRLNDKSESFTSYPSEWMENRWLMIELFQTVNSKKTAYFEVMLEGFNISPEYKQEIHIEGIEFVPVNKCDEDESEKSADVEHQPTSDMEWDEHLPCDYKQFISHLNKGMMNTHEVDLNCLNKRDAYSILSKGLLIDCEYEVPMWFWITKSYGKKCFMLPPILDPSKYNSTKADAKLPSNESRFKHVLESFGFLSINFKFRKGLLSTNTTYACYLVYKIPQGLVYDTPVEVTINDGDCFTLVNQPYRQKLIYLMIPQIPVIGLDGEKRHCSSSNKPKTANFPSKRKDGWWEVNIGEVVPEDQEAFEDSLPWIAKCIPMCKPWMMFLNDTFNARGTISSTVRIGLTIKENFTYPHLIVQGIEFRPI
ncbi:protein kinase-like domain-containing protein [Artemisia annua]|uniref:Protein kinase-like domain-containing protein n=1 Tax=Artemisia annua TaxID=35608 RepID=A0A2U1PZN0_ARTAN|nr:protein kinase-like domain-containing protein [Artemisia annua]